MRFSRNPKQRKLWYLIYCTLLVLTGARVQPAVARTACQGALESNETFQVGHLRVTATAAFYGKTFLASLTRDGELTLMGKALRLLASRPGQIVTYEDFGESLWPGEEIPLQLDWTRDAIERLRLLLRQRDPSLAPIQNVPNRGYVYPNPDAEIERDGSFYGLVIDRTSGSYLVRGECCR